MGLQSPTQLDPFFQEGGEVSVDPTWITVFGFPAAAESFILRQFRQYGIILQYDSQPTQSNWLHIQYKTKLQARKALSKNGKIIQGQIMIGVVPCVKAGVKAYFAIFSEVFFIRTFYFLNLFFCREKEAELRICKKE